MDTPTPEETLAAIPPPADIRPQRPSRLPAIIVILVVIAVGGLSFWYLLRPQPLLVQGEVDATRFDIAARIDGRVAEVPVERGQNIAAGAVLVREHRIKFRDRDSMSPASPCMLAFAIALSLLRSEFGVGRIPVTNVNTPFLTIGFPVGLRVCELLFAKFRITGILLVLPLTPIAPLLLFGIFIIHG